jgi:ABC-type lipoprotein release transport system permease subunit
MSKLKSILQGAVDGRLKTGGSVSAQLITQLRKHRRQQFSVFVAIEVLLVIGVGFCAYYLVSNPANIAQAKLLAGMIGVGAGGGIEVVRRIWKEWSQTELLLLMIEEASEAQVTAIIDRLIDKL